MISVCCDYPGESVLHSNEVGESRVGGNDPRGTLSLSVCATSIVSRHGKCTRQKQRRGKTLFRGRCISYATQMNAQPLPRLCSRATRHRAHLPVGASPQFEADSLCRPGKMLFWLQSARTLSVTAVDNGERVNSGAGGGPPLAHSQPLALL